MGTLLVGTDFSTRSDRALRRAMLLARQANYELLLVHVADHDGPTRPLANQRSKAADLLDEIERTIADTEPIACRTEIRVGEPSEQLILSARQSGAELILIGPHRRAFLRDNFSLTTAERITRNSTIPLLVAVGAPAGPYRRVMLPTDLGEASARAVTAVQALPFIAEADRAFLYLYDAEARQLLSRSMVSEDEHDSYLEVVAERARAELANHARDVGWAEARRVVHESSGSIAFDIVRVAAEEKADLIVLARCDKGGVAHAMLGSVTEAVLRKAERDLLIVPKAERPETAVVPTAGRPESR